MVPEGHRLGRLKVREARHHDVRVRLSLLGERPLQLRQQPIELIDVIAHIQPEIERHLVVARPCRVQAPGSGANQLGKPALHVHVDVFELHGEFKFAALDLSPNLLQALQDLACVGLGDDPLARQHFGVRLGAGDILGRHGLVEADRRVNLDHQLGG